MLILDADEKLVKESKNCALQIEQAGAAAKSQGHIHGILRPRLADSLDETIHSFLHEVRRKGCNSTLERIKRGTRRFEINTSNGCHMMSGAPGSGGSSRGGLPANLGYLLIKNGQVKSLPENSRYVLIINGRVILPKGGDIRYAYVEPKNGDSPFVVERRVGQRLLEFFEQLCGVLDESVETMQTIKEVQAYLARKRVESKEGDGARMVSQSSTRTDVQPATKKMCSEALTVEAILGIAQEEAKKEISREVKVRGNENAELAAKAKETAGGGPYMAWCAAGILGVAIVVAGVCKAVRGGSNGNDAGSEEGGKDTPAFSGETARIVKEKYGNEL